ncbi:ATP-binding protein [uncultured Desulfosarcina sp.]|uniref:hybrid sensor histidine kinase/response regulator n=1 Tax=uncultured Desulfosarcina sp. TaxID=218289 RepID=UPI0029C6EFCD|nr:ATP-binding protein [uncultured Desulfosarcina sp.]
MKRSTPPSLTLKNIKLRRGRSISRELTVSLVLLVLLVEGVLLLLIYNRQTDELYRRLEEKADEYAANLSETLAVPMWDLDDEQIRRIGEGFARNEMVASVLIRGAEGTVHYQSNRLVEDHPIHRKFPIIHTGRTLGHAEISLSVAAYRQEMVWLRNTALMVLAVSLVVIVIATGIILRVLMRKPLDILREGMDRIARGNGDYRFDKIHHEELADIAWRFETMADKVRQRERSLKKEVVERKRAEEKIRQSDIRTRAILNAIPDILFQFDREGRFVDMRGNPERLGISPDRCVGWNLEQVMPQKLASIFRRQLSRSFETGKVTVFEYELPFGEENRYYEARLVAVSDDLALGMVRNITERVTAADSKQRLMEQLQRAQKMEAIGMLAGGVAHDLNNVLSGVVSYPELILMDLPQDSPLRQRIHTIQKSGERAAHIVQDLLTLARRGVSVSEIVNLNEIVQDYLSSPECDKLRTYHPGIQLIPELGDDLLNVSGSPIHLTKTVMNLISNAAEATTDGGVVRIATRNCYIDTPIDGYDEIEEGDYVMLTVKDNGIGISEKDIDRIFEPFYTKKVMGRSGTGLGMAVVWGTVKDHHGYIHIDSMPNQGTTVTIHLPATRKRRAQADRQETIETLKGDGERILVVDDVAEQREIATDLLTRLGYSATSVAGGEAAAAYLHDREVDLVVLDMIMDPGIDGLETYRRILRIHPHQRALIASGYSESERVQEARRIGAGAYVKKPYRIETLARAVKTVLHG